MWYMQQKYVRARSNRSCDDEYGALLNGNRSGGLGSCLVKVPGLFCTQRIMHTRIIMVCRSFSLAVGRLKKKKKKKKKKEKMEKITVWPISVCNSSDVF